MMVISVAVQLFTAPIFFMLVCIFLLKDVTYLPSASIPTQKITKPLNHVLPVVPSLHLIIC